MTDTVKINRGLKGVYFERSGVSHIDGAKGELTYRGYSIHDLATQSSFEEVAYLLIHGELPDARGTGRFRRKAQIRPPPAARDPRHHCCLPRRPPDGRAAHRRVGAGGRSKPASREDRRGTPSSRTASASPRRCPMIIAAHEAIRNGGTPTARRPPTSAMPQNWLWMLKGRKAPAPMPRAAGGCRFHPACRAWLQRLLLLPPASPWAPEANLHGAIVTALATPRAGPAHGGAAEDVMKMVHEIGKTRKTPPPMSSKSAPIARR